MARRAFFSFHYELDVWRASQIRNIWVTQEREAAGFWDAASWEEVKKKGEDSIKRWIDNQLEGTSVTVVLIGAETNDRKYVDYEIQQSRSKGNGMLAVYIDKLKDQYRRTDVRGPNPFEYWHTTVNGQKVFFSRLYSTYDWVDDDGFSNLAKWIEQAARDAGK